jgi:hypothetical protein
MTILGGDKGGGSVSQRLLFGKLSFANEGHFWFIFLNNEKQYHSGKITTILPNINLVNK